MPKLRGGKSKKLGTGQRHKIERKKREHKRDLRKAAKAMKDAGQGPKRSKKSRETAKLAMKVSNAHPDKEEILTRLLHAREAFKVQRATKRLQSKEEEIAKLASRPEGEEGSAGEDDEEEEDEAPKPSATQRSILFIPTAAQNDFAFQFNTTLEKLVFPIPSAEEDVDVQVPCPVFLVTLDARCAVQCVPWTLLDPIVSRAEEYEAHHAAAAKKAAASKKRDRSEDNAPAAAETRRVLILFALTKCDLVSAQAIGTQFSLVAEAVRGRYFSTKENAARLSSKPAGSELRGGVVFGFVPFSTQFDKTHKLLLRILRQFLSTQPPLSGAQSSKNNLSQKITTFVIGFPNSGRRSLMRTLQVCGTESGVSMVPLRATVMQLTKKAADEEPLLKKGSAAASSHGEESIQMKFVFPNAKQITLVAFPEDHRLRSPASSSDIVFKSFSFVEKMLEPEHVAIMLVHSAVNKVGLAQAFCQPAIDDPEDPAAPTAGLTDDEKTLKEARSASRFLHGIGHTVRREKGFHVCPLFVPNVGSAGRTAATSLTASTAFTSRQKSTQGTLLDASYSNATPSKLVRISSVVNVSKGKKGKKNMFVKRADGHNALKIGARTFIREFCQSKNVPWAILRGEKPLSPDQVAVASQVFSLSLFGLPEHVKLPAASPKEYFTMYLERLTTLLKDYLILLPHDVVEFSISTVVPTYHTLNAANGNDDASSSSEDEE